MKSLIKNTFWVTSAVLIIANLYLFVSGIKLSESINYYEKETARLHEQNIELDKQTSFFDSLHHAASIAAMLNFSNDSTPIQLENLKYAFNR